MTAVIILKLRFGKEEVGVMSTIAFNGNRTPISCNNKASSSSNIKLNMKWCATLIHNLNVTFTFHIKVKFLGFLLDFMSRPLFCHSTKVSHIWHMSAPHNMTLTFDLQIYRFLYEHKKSGRIMVLGCRQHWCL